MKFISSKSKNIKFLENIKFTYLSSFSSKTKILWAIIYLKYIAQTIKLNGFWYCLFVVFS